STQPANRSSSSRCRCSAGSGCAGAPAHSAARRRVLFMMEATAYPHRGAAGRFPASAPCRYSLWVMHPSTRHAGIVLPLVLGLAVAGLRADDSAFITERDVKVPMRDGVRLAANVFRPSAEGKFPAILMRTPY